MSKKWITLILAVLVLASSAFGQNFIQSIAPAQNNTPNASTGPGGLTSNSGLNVTVLPGPIFCRGVQEFIVNTLFTLPASSTSYIVLDCASNQVYVSTSAVGTATNAINLAKIVTGASTVSSTTDMRVANQFPITTDGYFVVPPSACTFNITGTAGTNNNTIQPDGASFTPALKASSTGAGASTDTLTCNIVLPTRLAASAGVVINDVTVMYGVQTTALTSVGAPSISTIAVPTPGAGETPSTVTPVAISGALTVTPVIGSANLTTTTAGAYFTEKVALGTPFTVGTDLQVLLFQQTFVQSAAAAQVVNVPGLIVHYTRVQP